MTDTTKVFIIGTVPRQLEKRFLQYVRDFDTYNPGCHFELGIEPPPDTTLREAVELMRVNPSLTFSQIFQRRSR